jgi:membrane protease YdiL (CAAX protease family)
MPATSSTTTRPLPPATVRAGLRHEALGPWSRFSGAARAHPLRAFLVVTFAFSWTLEVIAFAVLGLEFEVGVIAATFGPAVGAYAVIRAVDGSEGVRAWLRRFVQWRVDPRLYLFALGVLPAAVISSFVLLPDGSQKLADAGAAFPLSFLGMLVILSVLGGGQEEPGWRGFALPRMLERWGPVDASVRLGVVWAVWHMPLFVLVSDYDNAGTSAVSVIGMFFVFLLGLTIGFSVLQTWLYQRSGGSIFLAVLAHGAVNASSNFLPTTWLPTAAAFAAIGLLAVVVVIATHGRLGHDPGREAAPVRAVVGEGRRA